MSAKDKSKTFETPVKEIAGVVGLMLAIFSLLELFLPTSLVQPIGALIIGLGATIILVWMGRISLAIALPVWLTVGLVLMALSLIVSRPAVVAGAVIDSRGAPLSGTTLILTDSSGVDHKVVTDEEGTFEIRNIPEGKFTVSANGDLLMSGEVASGWARLVDTSLEIGTLVQKIEPTPIPTLTVTPTETAVSPAPTETAIAPSPTPMDTNTVVNMDSRVGWVTYDDGQGSSIVINSVSGMTQNAIELSYNLKESGYVGLHTDLPAKALVGANGLQFFYRGSGVTSTIELKLIYTPNSEGKSPVFSTSWLHATASGEWSSLEAPYADFLCWEATGCLTGESLNPARVARLDFAVSNKPGDAVGGGTLTLDEVTLIR